LRHNSGGAKPFFRGAKCPLCPPPRKIPATEHIQKQKLTKLIKYMKGDCIEKLKKEQHM